MQVFVFACVMALAIAADSFGQPFDAASIDKATITEAFKPYLKKAPYLRQGGWHLFVEHNDWAVIAVGLAPLEDERGNRIPVPKAKKAARANADKELAGAICGVKRTGEDSSSLVSDQSGDAARIRQRFLSLSREEVDAIVRRAELAGTWFVDRKKLVAVLVAVGNPGNQLFEATPTSEPSGLHFRNIIVEPAWREIFRSRRAILMGGASLYRQGNDLIILAVGRARLTGKPANDVQRERVARATAGEEVLRYVKGLEIAAHDEACLQQERLTQDEKTIFACTRETFESLRIEKVQGAVRMLKSVGSWESEKGDYFYQAFTVRLAELR